MAGQNYDSQDNASAVKMLKKRFLHLWKELIIFLSACVTTYLCHPLRPHAMHSCHLGVKNVIQAEHDA